MGETGLERQEWCGGAPEGRRPAGGTAVLEPPAFFGEMALIDFSARAADAIVNEDTELFFIPLQDLRSLIEVQHRIALKILYALCEVLAQRLRETNERYMNVFTIAQWGGANPDGPLPVP